jgi:glycosyltransferase involved in cell wall biosynthesis
MVRYLNESMDVIVLTTYHVRPVEQTKGINIFRTIPNLLETYVPNNAIYKNLRYLFVPAATFVSIFFIFLRYRPKLMHVHSSTSVTLGACLFSLLFRLPIVIDVQDLFPKDLPLRRIIKLGCSPRYIALGKKVEEMLISIGIPSQRILTLPLARLPITKEIAEKQIKEDKKETSILFIGELTRIKGIDILLEAFKLASYQSGNISLKIIGGGPMRSYCEEFIDSNDLNINLIGTLDHKKTLEEISISDIVIMASRTEGYPRVILEAFEFEKPVIATNVGGIPQILKDGENGILVNPCDPSGLADAMLKLSKDKARREDLGKNGKKSLVELSTFEVVSRKILEFYGL